MRNSNEKERRGNEIEAVRVAMRDPNQLRNKNLKIALLEYFIKNLSKNFRFRDGTFQRAVGNNWEEI